MTVRTWMSASTTAAAVCHFLLLDWGAASVVIFCSSRADTKEDELQIELYRNGASIGANYQTFCARITRKYTSWSSCQVGKKRLEYASSKAVARTDTLAGFLRYIGGGTGRAGPRDSPAGCCRAAC
jgi:hypothetical protein